MLPIFRCQRLLDEAWHTFILDTPAYHAFCNEHLGGFVHRGNGFCSVVFMLRDDVG